ncbi:calcium-responsive transcription factor-like [Rhipicephalus sanguineus]|uniref:calcium-responsive transcription factor-like n=1 Tax=Rhipicephalus sanguineus TaxID=34632 RepID=UPI0020C5ABF4|nr:calcium-responsive transcription factor-like [Rhipicephalus sanguineus]
MSSAASSSKCNGTEEDTLRKHLRDLKRDGTQWTGFVESETSLQALTRDFAVMNVSYTTESSHYKSEEQRRKAKLVFSASKGAVPISLTAPFRVLSSVHKGCIFGKDRHNVQSQQEQNKSSCTGSCDWNADTFKKTKIKVQGTKKKGCPATMHITEIEVFPEHCLNLPPDASERRRKQASKAALSRLAEKLQTTEGASEVISEKRYYISLTSKEGHKNHTFDTALSHAQPVDPRVSERIQTLVKGGITSVKEVQRFIGFFVQDVLFASETPPPESSRAFFPTKKDFENHIQTALRKERFSDED